MNPPKLAGCLDKYDYFEVIRCIGRENTNLSIRDLLNAPDSDELIRGFAIIVSTRGVIFLRDQELSLKEQNTFTQRLGILSGKPREAGIHIHPPVRTKADAIVYDEAQNDPEAFFVSNRLWKVFSCVQSLQRTKWLGRTEIARCNGILSISPLPFSVPLFYRVLIVV